MILCPNCIFLSSTCRIGYYALVLRKITGPLNVLSDSAYMVNVVRTLDKACNVSRASTIFSYLWQLLDLLAMREHPIFIDHIQAHSNLPGPLSHGNMLADHYSRFLLACSIMEEARQFHSKWHVNSTTLSQKFNISRKQVEDIIKSCEKCVTALAPKISVGANPPGLQPCHTRHLDVTHIPSLGSKSCVHVTVDTYSGVVMATALNKEGNQQVIQQCLQSFAAWGIPQIIKIDNSLAYTSARFATFLKEFGIEHITGIPYNPQGQGIVERTHLYFKTLINKQRGGIGEYMVSNKYAVALAIYTTNCFKQKKMWQNPSKNTFSTF